MAKYTRASPGADALVAALRPFALIAQKITEAVKDKRWLEQPLFFMGDDKDPQKYTLTGKAFNDALQALAAVDADKGVG